jgi:hypothetical protein
LKALEELAGEKEKQLLDTISHQKLQIAAARKEEAQLKQQLTELLNTSTNSNNSKSSLEEEVESLQTVLRMRGLELDQLRVANNTLLLEMERYIFTTFL